MSKKIKKPSKQELQELYDEVRSTTKIAKKLGVCTSSIRNWMIEYGIQRRSSSECQLKKGVIKPSKERLEYLYWELRLSTTQIAKQINVVTACVRNWMQEYKIPRRTNSDSQLSSGIKPSRKQLVDIYYKKKMSLVEIARKYGVSIVTISNWAKGYGIKKRKERPSKQELQESYSELKSITKIAERYEVTGKTICNWMEGYGIAKNGNSNRDDSQLESLLEQYVGGENE